MNNVVLFVWRESTSPLSPMMSEKEEGCRRQGFMRGEKGFLRAPFRSISRVQKEKARLLSPQQHGKGNMHRVSTAEIASMNTE